MEKRDAQSYMKEAQTALIELVNAGYVQYREWLGQLYNDINKIDEEIKNHKSKSTKEVESITLTADELRYIADAMDSGQACGSATMKSMTAGEVLEKIRNGKLVIKV